MSSDEDSLRDSSPVPMSISSQTKTISKHVFQVHNYKKPTFCAHCDNLLVGVIRQGVRCKRCGIDVHDKCQEDLKKQCIEMLVGRHNFKEKTYTRPTYCDYCENLLVGLVNQGLKCTECEVNVHERCQEKIEVSCEKTKARLQAPKETEQAQKQLEPNSSSIDRGRPTRLSRRRQKLNEKTPLSPPGSETEEGSRNYSKMFETMPDSKRGGGQASTSSADSKPRAPSTKATQALQQQVGEVTSIMKQNLERIEMREANLLDLEKQSSRMAENASQFKKHSENLKKKFWLKNKKLWIIIGVTVLIIVLIIVAVVVVKLKSGSNSSSGSDSNSKTSTG